MEVSVLGCDVDDWGVVDAFRGKVERRIVDAKQGGLV